MSTDDVTRVWVHNFDNETVRALEEAVENVAADAQPVLPVFINLCGGSLLHLFAMLDLFASCEVPVATICIGTAQSAALDLLAAGTRGHRYCGPSATLMAHDSSDGWSSRKNTEVQAYAKQAQIERDRSFDLFAKHTRRSRKFWDAWLAKRQNADVFLTAAEAIALGIADHAYVPTLTVKPARASLAEPKRKR